jgi:hypothetical protein
VLTFFDYLRQRAFDSVLTGAQEALEFLESQSNRDQPKLVSSQSANRPLDHQPPETSEQGKRESTQNEPVAEVDDDLLPPPRRRGRPKKNSKGNQ